MISLRQKPSLADADSSSRTNRGDRKIYPPVAGADCRSARQGGTIQMTLRHLTRDFDFNNRRPLSTLDEKTRIVPTSRCRYSPGRLDPQRFHLRNPGICPTAWGHLSVTIKRHFHKGITMNIIARVKEILLTPKQAWSVIEIEETDTATLYTQYIMILAAIQAVAGFIGMSLVGVSAFGVSVRVPLITGLVQMVLGYGLTLAMVYVLALIADALAPSFGGQKRGINALKLVAYNSTAAMVGGIFALIPALGVLTLLAALYSLYLLYLGVPTLMKVPQEKALPYTAVLVVCAIVVGVIAGAILGTARGGPTMGLGMATGQMSIETPKGTVNVDVAKMEAWSKRMEAVGKKLEKAQQSGDQAAMEQAIKEMASLQGEQPMVVPKR